MKWIITDDRPIWLQLYEQLSTGIVSGQYPSGSRLPAVRELAAEAGVNPNTMQRALAQLEERGLAVSCRTAGRLVTEDQQLLQETRRALAESHIRQYLAAMQTLGYEPAEAAALLREEEHHA